MDGSTPIKALATAPEILPEWDLTSVIAGPQDPALAERLTRCENIAELMAASEGKVAGLPVEALAHLLALDERIAELQDQVTAPLTLLCSRDLEDEDARAASAAAEERIAAIDARIAFFDAELCVLGRDRLTMLANEPALRRFRPSLRHLAQQAPHALSSATERALALVSPGTAWARRFDDMTGAMRFPWNGKRIPESDLNPLLHDRDVATRRKAWRVLEQSYARKQDEYAAVLDELIRIGQADDTLRGRANPEDAMLDSVGLTRDHLKSLETAHRESLAIERRWTMTFGKALGLSFPLEPGDLEGDLAGVEEFGFTFAEALAMIERAWAKACPNLAPMVRAYLKSGRIDARPRAGKEPGALCQYGDEAFGAWILMTWIGRVECVLTLAHEVGHALHGMLMACQPIGTRDPGLVMDETASTFSEMIVGQEILAAAPSPRARKAALAAIIHNRAGYIFEQMNRHEIEKAIWAERAKGPLSAERLNEITRTISLAGNADIEKPSRGLYWAWCWHLFHVPYYIFTYAAADCISGGLFAKRHEPGFGEKFETLLASGGANLPQEALAPFGIDLSSVEFWRAAYRSLERQIDLFDSI